MPVIVIVAVPGGSSATSTVSVNGPSSAYVWPPCTAKLPPPTLRPRCRRWCVPSPQLIRAVKSLAVFVGKPVSLKVATCVSEDHLPLGEHPQGSVIAPFARTSASVTVPVLEM